MIGSQGCIILLVPFRESDKPFVDMKKPVSADIAVIGKRK
jgi:hypothetical protein